MFSSFSDLNAPSAASFAAARPEFKTRNWLLSAMLFCLLIWGYFPIAEVYGTPVIPFEDQFPLTTHFAIWPLILLCLFGAKRWIMRLYVALLWAVILWHSRDLISDISDTIDMLSMFGGSSSDNGDLGAILELVGKFLRVGIALALVGLFGFLIAPIAPFYRSNDQFWKILFSAADNAEQNHATSSARVNSLMNSEKSQALKAKGKQLAVLAAAELKAMKVAFTPVVGALKNKDVPAAKASVKEVNKRHWAQLAGMVVLSLIVLNGMFGRSLPNTGDVRRMMEREAARDNEQLEIHTLDVRDCEMRGEDTAVCILEFDATVTGAYGYEHRFGDTDYAYFELVDGEWTL
uniref:hypothetical protein n=1 Tax=Thaumasiovibrio occultus TaxID=1891184 RepID=UPI000B34C943|nr:hypothetical protein [Thaumasiovibrio occultus]